MQRIFYFILLIFIFNSCYAKGNEGLIGNSIRGTTGTEVTSRNRITISNEFNLYNGDSSVLYGLPSISYDINSAENKLLDGLSFSIISQNIPIVGSGAQNYEMDTYIGISKFSKVTDTFGILIGSLNGTDFRGAGRLHHQDYLDFRYRGIREIIVHSGIYYVDKGLSLSTNYLGYMGGIEINLEKWNIDLDYWSGSNNLSGGSYIMTYKGFGSQRVWFGLGIPEHNSGNEFYGILGFSYRY